MLEYRCPECRRKLFEADAELQVRVEIKCARCSETVVPKAFRPRHITYICGDCKRVQHYEHPKYDRTYCVPCGRHSMASHMDRAPVRDYVRSG